MRARCSACIGQRRGFASNRSSHPALRAGSVLDLFETRHLLAIDFDRFEEDIARTQPKAAVGGAVDDHGREVGFEDGLVDIVIDAALVVTIACHGDPAGWKKKRHGTTDQRRHKNVRTEKRPQ